MGVQEISVCLLVCLSAGVVMSSVTETPGCSELPHVENGRYEEMGAPLSTLRHTCVEGYRLEGSHILTCLNGTWWPEPPKCVKIEAATIPTPCVSGPMVHNAHVEYENSFEKARVVCNPGYFTEDTHVTAYYIKCDKYGSWFRLRDGGLLLRCMKHHCGSPPVIPNAKYQVSEYSPLMVEGAEVTYRCVEGYRLLGQDEGKLTCHDGEWQGPIPTCEAVSTCNHPGYMKNGRWKVEYSNLAPPRMGVINHQASQGGGAMFQVGTLLLYSCDKGFRLDGPDILECRPSQIWSHDPPICIPQSEHSWFCPEVGGVNNGFCKCLGQETADLDLCRPFLRGTRLDCRCLQGYAREGLGLLTCTHSASLDSGVWDRPLPICRKIFAPDSDMDDVLPEVQNDGASNYNSADIKDGKSKVSSLVIVVTTACSVFGVLLLIMVVVIFRRKKPRAPLFQQSPATPPYARVHNNSMDEHDRLALMAYAEASRLHLPTYEEAMRPGPGNNPLVPSTLMGPVGVLPPPVRPEYNARLPTIHPAVRAANLQLQQAMAGDGNNNINNNNNNNSNRHSTITTSTMNRDGVSETFGSVDTVNVSMSDASTSVTVETFESGTSTRSMSSQRATAGSLHSSDDQLATDNAPLLDSSSQREVDVVSVSSNPSRSSKEE